MSYKLSMYNIIAKKIKNDYIIYNSRSGAVCSIPDDDWKKLKNNIELDDNYMDELYKQGIIVHSNYDEYNSILCNTSRENYKYQETLQFVIATTMNCNLNCIYCFEEHKNNISLSDNDIENIYSFIINSLKVNPAVKKLHITWFGGEPLLAFKQLITLGSRIKSFCDENNVYYYSTMITNGILLTEDRLTELVEKTNLIKVQITLDGLQKNYCLRKRATPEQYNMVIKNIYNAIKKIKVVVRVNCDKDNIDERNKIVEELYTNSNNSKNLTIYLAQIVDYLGNKCCNTLENSEFAHIKNEFENSLVKKFPMFKLDFPKKRYSYCGMSRLQNFAIGPNGDLYKCEHCIGDEDKRVGNCVDGVYYNDYYEKFMNYTPPKYCKKCSLFPICAGGCTNENLYQKNKTCKVRKDKLALIKDRISKLY